MATCAKCGVPLEPASAACANCGRIVPREQMPLWLGWLFGILLTFALWLVVVVAWILTVGVTCGALSPGKLLCGAIIVVCLAALAGGIDAARRGYPARAVIFLVPAIGALVPAAACTASVFAARC